MRRALYLLLLITASAQASYRLDVGFPKVEYFEKDQIAAISVKRDGYLGSEGAATVRLHIGGAVLSEHLRFLPDKQVTTAFFVIDDEIYTPLRSAAIQLFDDIGRLVETRTMQIIENEAVPQVSIADAFAKEGDELVFTVSVRPANSEAISLRLTVSPGTATEQFDYSPPLITQIMIPAGATQQTFRFHTWQDRTSESDETVRVRLADFAAPTVAQFGRRDAIGNIGDDERVFDTIAGPDRIGLGIGIFYSVKFFPHYGPGGTIKLKSSAPEILSVPDTIELQTNSLEGKFQALPHLPGDVILTAEIPAAYGGSVVSKKIEVRDVAIPAASKSSIVLNPHGYEVMYVWAVGPSGSGKHLTLRVADPTIASAPPSVDIVEVPEVTIWALKPGKTELWISVDAESGGATLSIPIEVRATNRRHSAR